MSDITSQEPAKPVKVRRTQSGIIRLDQLSVEVLNEIKQVYETQKFTRKEIAKTYNLSECQVATLAKRSRWKGRGVAATEAKTLTCSENTVDLTKAVGTLAQQAREEARILELKRAKFRASVDKIVDKGITYAENSEGDYIIERAGKIKAIVDMGKEALGIDKQALAPGAAPGSISNAFFAIRELVVNQPLAPVERLPDIDADVILEPAALVDSDDIAPTP